MSTARRGIHTAAVIGVIVAAGCSEGAGSSGPVTVRDSAGLQIVENDLARLSEMCAVSIEPTVAIGSTAGDESYELYRVFGASKLSDGRIVLVNQGSQQLRYYDAVGRHLKSVGRAGKGPGEFQDAFYLWVLPGDTVWVGDYRPWQFHVFSPDGEFVRTVRPTPQYGNPPGVMNVLDDGRAVLADRAFSSNTTFALRHLTVVIHNADGSLADTVGTYPNGRYGKLTDTPGALNVYPLFESFARVAAAGSRIVVGHGDDPQLTILEAAAQLRASHVLRWTTQPRAISPEDIKAERRRIEEPYKDMDPAARRELVEPLVSEKRPVAEQFPAFSTVMLGRDGRIWVKDYVRPRELQTRWTAYGPDGRFVCGAVLPDVEQVLEFGADYVLALHHDDMDVERVVEYTLARPEPMR